MNVVITRLVSALAALGALSLGILAIVPEARAASTDAVDGELQGMQHEATLQSGEKLLLTYNWKKVSNYRVCIPEQPGDLKVKVFHDGEVTEVLDGTCETVSGRHIDVMAESKIPAGDEMVLKIRHAKA
jgi:hypothetical protein